MLDLVGTLVITGIAFGIFLLWKYDRISSASDPTVSVSVDMDDPNGIIRNALDMLEQIFDENHIPASHGMVHARRVMQHVIFAIRDNSSLSIIEKLAIMLAALLHDADDRKYFPTNKNYENARYIVQKLCPGIESLVIDMISFVSTSSNGSRIPNEAELLPWLLYPRWADRLEAAGWIGVVRAWEYSLETSLPLFTDKTPKAHTLDELMTIATKQRYASYKGKSASMIDHYYDKLLHICDFQTDNKYLLSIAKSRRTKLITVCLAYGNGELTNELLETARKLSQLE